VSESPEIHSLYRRFRPQRFEEVLGQEHVTRALRNAVANQKVSHAYLFSGPRGTGKTSTARILAKALNCADPSEGEPCGECDSCVLVREGRSYDVEELDAASNSGVDAIRSLISTVATASFGTWKIYIIDEVHMLSTAASNALLKTLEEPPEHVVFVLATTLKQKVLQTIVSRTQHFEFKLLSDDDISRLVAEVAEKAALTVGQEDLAWAQRRGGGSARDTLSYLDQVAALGGIPNEELDGMLDLAVAVLGGDAAAVVSIVERMTVDGNDPQQIASDMLGHVRDAFVYVVTSRDGGAAPPPLFRRLTEQGVEVSAAQLSRTMEAIGRSSLDLRDGIDPVVVLEAILVGVSGDNGAPRSLPGGPGAHVAVFEDRIRLLEDELKALRHDLSELMRGRVPTGAVGPAPAPVTREAGRFEDVRRGMMRSQTERSESEESVVAPAPVVRTSQVTTPAAQEPVPQVPEPSVSLKEQPGELPIEFPAGEKSPSPSREAAAALPSRERLVVDWDKSIRGNVKPMARALFQSARFFKVDGDKVVVAFDSSFYIERAKPLSSEIENAIANHYGVPKVRLELVVQPGESQEPTQAEQVTTDEPSTDELLDDFMKSEESIDTSPIAAAVTRVFPGAKPID
jgi:DNA polymerase-3 subunit gamma/tau